MELKGTLGVEVQKEQPGLCIYWSILLFLKTRRRKRGTALLIAKNFAS